MEIYFMQTYDEQVNDKGSPKMQVFQLYKYSHKPHTQQ